MRKEPVQRYQSAEEMLKDLQKVTKKPEITFDYEYPEEDTPSDTDENEPANAKYVDEAEKRRSPAFNIITGALVSLVLCAILFVSLALLHSCEASNTEAVDVPNFVGMNYSEIEGNASYNFKWDVINVYDSSKPEGEIIKQEPEAGSKKVKEGAVVTLTVNSSDTLIGVPYVTSEPEETAVAKIKAKGLTAEVIYIEDEGTAENIVRDTSPKAGSDITVTEKVKVFVKKTDEVTTVQVPDLSGKTRDEASEIIASAGLVFDYDYNNDIDVTAESVIGQSPLKGSVVEMGSTVKAYVAKGVDKYKIYNMTVSLPSNATTACEVRVTVDGVLDETASGTMVPAEVGRISFSVRGKDTSVVYIEVDGQIWKKFEIDFVNEKTKLYPGSYTPALATEPPTTVSDTDDTDTDIVEPTEAPTTEEPTETDYEITG